MAMLEKTGETGSHIFNRIEPEKPMAEVSTEDSQKEADAVARAIGIPTEYSASTILKRKRSRASEVGEGLELRKVASGRSDYTSGPESPSPTGRLMDNRSPESDNLESPSFELDDQLDEAGKETDDLTEVQENIDSLNLGQERKRT